MIKTTFTGSIHICFKCDEIETVLPCKCIKHYASSPIIILVLCELKKLTANPISPYTIIVSVQLP